MFAFGHGERGKPENPGKTSQKRVENQKTHHFQPAGRESSKIFQQLQVQLPGGAECQDLSFGLIGASQDKLKY